MTEAARALEDEARSGGALERAFPELAEAFPRLPCTTLPTRVHRLEKLGTELDVELWVKRDDETGTLYGGNKPRKLEFLLGDARRKGKRSILTFGGIGTNHGLATALYGRRHGFSVVLVLLRQPVTSKVRHGLLLCRAAGAELHYAPSLGQLVARTLGILVRRGARGDLPYVVPTGGSSPVGVLGFVDAALELKEQIAQGLLPEPGWVFVPVGTAGTLAGLVLGFRLAGLSTRVAGVLVTDILPPTRKRVLGLVRATHELLRRKLPSLPDLDLAAEPFRLVHGFVGPGYGTPTASARAARDEVAELEGLKTETTYTAKCLAALRELARLEPYRTGPVLYWHTYSGVDPTDQLGTLPDFRELPDEFHPLFEGPPVPD
ncbi:MAG: 1-aminocyclopropane-1-carboxylate deaminase [Candidatus Binatia bacterium]|nr:MAG: 1-aminocyclopropane-1-carboxylate deaminase [Candidatus Binatia bacterium]